MSDQPPEATPEAVTAAQQVVRVQHGDNDPVATAELQMRVAMTDAWVPRKVAVDHGSAMVNRTYRDPASWASFVEESTR